MNQTNPDLTPLHTLNPLSRFSDRAEDYVKSRPSYPAEAIDIILEGLALPSQLVAADIGAGTGISSRLLAERGVSVIAIEPNPAMREAAEPHSRVEFRDGTAEVTHLNDSSVDLVTCFQAFHWFKPEPTLSEFRRILKSSGRLAVVWNNRDQTDEFTAEYSRLVRIASNNHPGESRMKSDEPLFTSPHFSNIREYSFVNRQQLDLTGLISRAMSSSYVPREGVAQQELVSGLQELYQRFRDQQGFVYFAYETSVHLAQPTV
ncbi:class I SAM-dependent methyltransferase [Aetokthonos hydrillicola Thurmond2011]|jgi:SAM-dependent methyltransferase|uniref:Class I SAM-dependent methyltransferase n=1 Tax=Aetokthonos hydrillicola Thurmond2011 TaxID=2712845 RepID=A0AAP5I6L8_9CYAN|nr:class I SAM-dependent methyltransferase [Aetokthonos hydrillicola]MBW4586856.1 class I SAM-dependent methyltransferase [Aetokthonos hydrillicola CCALA 1050]MDR9895786.1 class I SAM-dependent methyltransferase [Aetokthonos hydrillicola Thurmond2011]